MTRHFLDERLRADAAGVRHAPSPELHGRIMAGLSDQEALPRPLRSAPRTPALAPLAAAAAVVLLASVLFVVARSRTSADSLIQARSEDVVELSRGILNPPLLASMAELEDPLMAEALNLWADTSRAAESVARGLRTPWRLRKDG